jgi:hypothetical protein
MHITFDLQDYVMHVCVCVYTRIYVGKLSVRLSPYQRPHAQLQCFLIIPVRRKNKSCPSVCLLTKDRMPSSSVS